MGSPDAKAYVASPEVLAASALKGTISGPGWYEKPAGVEKVVLGEGNGDPEQDRAMRIGEALDKIISQADFIIEPAEKSITGDSLKEGEETEGEETEAEESLTSVLPGFPEKVEGEIIFCDADNINIYRIYPWKIYLSG
jgi:homoaconitate hydratase